MVTIAVQAGGRSSRMGRDKGLVTLGSMTMIEHVIGRLAGLGDEIIITTNHPEDYAFLGLPLYSDPKPGAGAAFGLHTALTGAKGETVLVAACDMPFIQPNLAEYMLQALTPDIDVIVPYRQQRYEPLLAVYRRRTCLEALSRAINQGRRRMISFYSGVNVLKIEDEQLNRLDSQGLSFFNINTPDELAAAERLYRNQPGQEPQ